jgi:glycerophosphoryl diester phosphodiesterase
MSDENNFPIWQLHRGYWKKGFRENTMDSFREARRHGVEMVELDVQVSRDGIPHSYHDYNLKKFFHIDEELRKQKSEDLSALNIPTLEEILKSPELPDFLNIEMKSIDLFCYQFSKKICRVIDAYGENKKILISSFNPMCLYWAKKRLPHIHRALIIGDKKLLFNWKFRFSMLLSSPHFLNIKYKLVDDEISFKRIKSYKRPYMIWTVNDHGQAREYLTQGATSIISDLLPISNLL